MNKKTPVEKAVIALGKNGKKLIGRTISKKGLKPTDKRSWEKVLFRY